MQADLIIVSEYCRQSRIEPTFVTLLEEYGLIELDLVDGEQYLQTSQLRDVEIYSRMYYDLSINMEGIDVIHHLLGRIDNLHHEIAVLKNRLKVFQTDDF